MQSPVAARILGFAGLIPFVVLAATAALAPEAMARPAREGAIFYGAAILSFMGGCRWGFAAAGLGQGPRFEPLAISVLPALLAWAGLWLGPSTGAAWTAAILVAGFLALFADDVRAERNGETPAWWSSLRAPLTAGATLSLAIAGLSAL